MPGLPSIAPGTFGPILQFLDYILPIPFWRLWPPIFFRNMSFIGNN